MVTPFATAADLRGSKGAAQPIAKASAAPLLLPTWTLRTELHSGGPCAGANSSMAHEAVACVYQGDLLPLLL